MAVADFGAIRILSAETCKPESRIALPGHHRGFSPAISLDGSIVAMPIGHTLALFDVRTGRRLHHDARMPKGSVGTAAWSRGSEQIVTGHYDGMVRVWDAQTGKLIWQKLMAPVIGPAAGPPCRSS